MPFEPITTPNVAETAAQQLRKLIATDVLRPGDQLPGERDLAARMNISRTSLRSALRTLVAEGLLLSRHGAGLWVASGIGGSITDPLSSLLSSSPDAMIDFVEFRIMMESESAALVAQTAMQPERDHINMIHEKLRDATDADDLEDYVRADADFHMSIIEGTGNVVLIQIARSLESVLTQTVSINQRAAFRIERDGDELKRQHKRINDAIQARDAPEARAAMKHHLEYFRDLLKNHEAAENRAHVIEHRKAWAKQR